MNKKFLSAILFGALMLTSTGTFVSCKDYDDDITNLETQVSGLSALSSQVTTMQNALSAATSSAQSALDKANANGGDIAALEKELAALKEATVDVDALKKQIDEAIAEGIAAADLEGLKKQIEEQLAKVTELAGAFLNAVTSVELVITDPHMLDAQYGYNIQALEFSTITEKDNVFEDNMTGAITFTAGKQTQTGNSFIVRVSPASAALTPEMISFIAPEGINLNEYVQATEVKRWTGALMTPWTKAEANTGLWEVKVALVGDTYKADDFAKMTTYSYKADKCELPGCNAPDVDHSHYRLFAVAVNSTANVENGGARDVISNYALVMDHTDFEPYTNINFWVDDKNVTTLNNRYENGGNNPSLPKTTAAITYDELVWAASTKDAPTPAVEPIITHKEAKYINVKAATDAEDNRSELDMFPAVQGKAFKVKIDKAGNVAANKIATPAEVRGMYVTLDFEENAIESAPSEWNAWKGYKISGIDQVVTGTELEITIDGDETINDIIGFRVYAVNQDGTLLDPDGKAFYAIVGNAGKEWGYATTITPAAKRGDDAGTIEANAISVKTAVTDMTALAGIDAATWSTDKIGDTKPVFNAYFYDKDGAELGNTTTEASMKGIKYDKVASVKTMPVNVNKWYLYEDDKAYEGTMTLKDEYGFVLATVKVTMTKVLPTELPSKFSVKAEQLNANNIYNCYLIPTEAGVIEDGWDILDGTVADKGTMKMLNVFNFGKDDIESQDYAPYYEITFAETTYSAADEAMVEVLVKGNKTLEVNRLDGEKGDVKMIDNTTKHATEVYYNFGKISSALITYDKDGKTIKSVADYTKNAAKFETVYNCIYNSTYSWNWASATELGVKEGEAMPYQTALTYGKATNAGGAVDTYAKYIWGYSSYYALYNCKLSEPYMKSLKIKEAHLVTKADGQVDEYFTVTLLEDADGNNVGIIGFTPNPSTTTNPNVAVPSTLKITLIDMYDCEIPVALDMTVMPDKN